MSVVESFVPASVTGALRRVLGVDVSDVTVRRGPGIARAAERLGARGYTRGGVVHVPDAAGSLDGGTAAPLLAHELTHVAQQRRFGGALPDLATAEGQRLEADAVAVEQWYAGGAGGEPPQVLGHLDPARRRLPSRTATVADADPTIKLPKAAPTTFADLKRMPQATTLPVVSAAGLKSLWRAAQDPEQPVADFWDAPEAHVLPDVSMTGLENMWRDLQRTQSDDDTEEEDEDDAIPPAKPATRRLKTEPVVAASMSIEEIKDELADDPPVRWMNLDDPDDFDELSDRLYNTLVSRLRFDVLVERERSGTLLDFG